MSTIAKISPGGQVRVPKQIMEKLNISTGDYLDFEIKEGNVVLKAKKLIDADQAWFWTKEWQEAEREAEEDVKKGRLSKVFTSADEGISYLRKKKRELKSKRKRD